MLPISIIGLLVALLLFLLPRIARLLAARQPAPSPRLDDGHRSEEIVLSRALFAPAKGPPEQARRPAARVVSDAAPAPRETPAASAAATAAEPLRAPSSRLSPLARIEALPRYKRAIVWSEILGPTGRQ